MGDDGERGKAKHHATQWQSIKLCFVLGVIITACNPSSSTTSKDAVSPSPLRDIDKVVDGGDQHNDSSNPSLSNPQINPIQEHEAIADQISPNPASPTGEGEELSLPTPEPFPPLVDEDETTFIETALSMYPDDASIFEFTHWSRIKKHFLVPYLTSEYDEGERQWFTKMVTSKNLQAAMLDHDTFPWQADLWGFDHSDLVWEARGVFDLITENISIIRLRSNFDFEGLINLLEERNYSSEIYRGVTIYSLSLTNESDWNKKSPLEFHSLALIEEEHILILSPTKEPVKRVIDVRQEMEASLYDNALVRRASFHLVNLFAAEIHLGSETCEKFGAAMDEAAATGGSSLKSDLVTSQLAKWPVQPYELLAFGHIISNDVQNDFVIFHYDDFRPASMDFENRRNLFFFGNSTNSSKAGVTYSAQFLLEDYSLDDALMVFRLIPTPGLVGDRQGWAQTILGWMTKYDGLFAACQVEEFDGRDTFD